MAMYISRFGSSKDDEFNIFSDPTSYTLSTRELFDISSTPHYWISEDGEILHERPDKIERKIEIVSEKEDRDILENPLKYRKSKPIETPIEKPIDESTIDGCTEDELVDL